MARAENQKGSPFKFQKSAKFEIMITIHTSSMFDSVANSSEKENPMEIEQVIDFIKDLGVGLRPPQSDFFKEGNEDCQSLKPHGFCDFDEENFYHKPYKHFSCHMPGCERNFETVIEYESHYNSCHSYTCKECNKNLPNYHLLDLHISETHDSFFKAQAGRKPMYKCFLEECKETFMNPHQRKDHCIKVHKFPSDFRFDSAKKLQGQKKKSSKKSTSQEQMEIVQLPETDKMEISENKSKKAQKATEFKGFAFGRGQGRRISPFYNFSKDLRDSLSESNKY